jgi:hypothetical protein
MIKFIRFVLFFFFLSEYLNLKQFLGIIISELGCQSKICINCTKHGILHYANLMRNLQELLFSVFILVLIFTGQRERSP